MARKTIRVSDKSGREISDGKALVPESRSPTRGRVSGSST